VFSACATSYTQALMIEGSIDGVAPDERTARKTIDRIRELTRQRPVVYLPSHDPEAGRRLEARETVAS
jgi:N-acyl homoserine lactone hydrolase